MEESKAFSPILTEEQGFVLAIALGHYYSMSGLVSQSLMAGELTTDELAETRKLLDRAGELMLERHGQVIPQATTIAVRAIKELLSWVPPEQPETQPMETLQ